MTKIIVQTVNQEVTTWDLSAAERLIDEYLAHADVQPSSRISYKKKLTEFFKFCMASGISQPTRKSVLDYKRHLIEKGMTPYSIGGYLTPVRGLAKWMNQSNPAFVDFASGVKGVRTRGHCRDAYSVDQLTRILGSIDRSTLVGLRDYALIRLLATCGLRTIEVERAARNDIRNVNGETVLFVMSKGATDKSDFVVIPSETLRALEEYFVARGPNKPDEGLFTSVGDGNFGTAITTRTIRHITKTRARACGIDSDKLSAHSYRHFFVSTAVAANVPLDQVREAARHRSLLSTQVYLHRARRAEGLTEKTLDDIISNQSKKTGDVSS